MLIFSFLELHIGLDLQKLRLKKKVNSNLWVFIYCTNVFFNPKTNSH